MRWKGKEKMGEREGEVGGSRRREGEGGGGRPGGLGVAPNALVLSESPIRVAYPSRLSEIPLRLAYASHSSGSIRVCPQRPRSVTETDGHGGASGMPPFFGRAARRVPQTGAARRRHVSRRALLRRDADATNARCA